MDFPLHLGQCRQQLEEKPPHTRNEKERPRTASFPPNTPGSHAREQSTCLVLKEAKNCPALSLLQPWERGRGPLAWDARTEMRVGFSVKQGCSSFPALCKAVQGRQRQPCTKPSSRSLPKHLASYFLAQHHFSPPSPASPSLQVASLKRS